MKILFAASEAAPFFKTGGLGDVAYALPKELVKQGVDIRVVLPYYSTMPAKYKADIKELLHFRVQVGWKSMYCGVKTLELDGVTYYFIDIKPISIVRPCTAKWMMPKGSASSRWRSAK